MSSRDDFETAFINTLGDTVASVWYLKEHRVREDYYLFENDLLTGMTNAAWWAWRAGRDALASEAQAMLASQEKPDVVH